MPILALGEKNRKTFLAAIVCFLLGVAPSAPVFLKSVAVMKLEQRSSFLVRKKDDLAAGLLIAFVTSILTLLITFVVQSLTKQVPAKSTPSLPVTPQKK